MRRTGRNKSTPGPVSGAALVVVVEGAPRAVSAPRMAHEVKAVTKK